MSGGEVEAPLIGHARRFASSLTSDNAWSNFIVRIRVCTDAALLRKVTREFSLVPEIALPAWQRLAEVEAGNPVTLLEVATAFYGYGHDEAAAQLVDQALELDKVNIMALELKAALKPDARERRKVFEEILRIDPGNRVAVDNLILLDRPR